MHASLKFYYGGLRFFVRFLFDPQKVTSWAFFLIIIFNQKQNEAIFDLNDEVSLKASMTQFDDFLNDFIGIIVAESFKERPIFITFFTTLDF